MTYEKKGLLLQAVCQIFIIELTLARNMQNITS